MSLDLNRTFSDISIGGQYHLEGGAKDFYGWVYTSAGVTSCSAASDTNLAGKAVAHGNGRTGAQLTDYLLSTRLATARAGGGFVDYQSTRRAAADGYGLTHGSYLLPIYDASGVVTHFVGTSFSAAVAEDTLNEPQDYFIPFISFLVLSGVLICVVVVAVGMACRNKQEPGYCSLSLMENPVSPDTSNSPPFGERDKRSFATNEITDEMADENLQRASPVPFSLPESDNASDMQVVEVEEAATMQVTLARQLEDNLPALKIDTHRPTPNTSSRNMFNYGDQN